MTGAVASRRVRPPLADGPPPAAPPFASRSRVGVELVVFAALGAVVLMQWSRLVGTPPAARLLLVLAVACAAGLLLTLAGRTRLPRPVAAVVAVAVGAAALAATLLAIGVPGRLLTPANWGELRADLSFGFAGVQQAEFPYTGNDEWVRLALLSVGPAVLAATALLAFWPGRRRERRRLFALLILVGAYGTAVTLDAPGGELLWGVVLLLLIAAWVWGPRLSSPEGARAAATVATAGVLALPLAAMLDPKTPWWDYQSWSWFGSERTVTYDWDHDYGPLDWPQVGTKLLEVGASAPLYWKAVVLDRFDGFTWQRARYSDVYAVREQVARRSVPGENLPTRRDEWLREVSFEVRALQSPFVVGAGITQGVQGIEGAAPNPDGTIPKSGAALEAGDEYSILTYAPDPTIEELRAAPRRYPKRLRSQVLVGLPVPRGTSATAAAGESPALGSLEPVAGTPMALWGTRDPRAEAAAEVSAYADVYRLAHRLVADAPTPYDAATAVQRYLHRNYSYDADVQRASYPLDSFLFDQREGYCQQFSGAMALMLRMVGIPSRVATGFAPGTLDEERDVYTVRDTDAHSWVEVYFRGIGWVNFDPTPAAAPAISQSLNELAAFRGVDRLGLGGRERDGQERDGNAAEATPGVAEQESGLPWAAIGIAAAGAALVGLTLIAVATCRRRRAFLSGGAGEAQLDELLAALGQLGWGLPPRATLLALERRFRSAGRPAVEAYAAALRLHRFAPDGAPPPGPAQRRALRRALSGGAGPRRRLRGLRAIPFGGPRLGRG